jgi:DNA-directed RNA polymerase specialized sigma24 family protein
MERLSAVAELPIRYAVAVRLRDSGASDRTIATALAIDVDEVGLLLAMADAKLAAIVGGRD